MALSPTLPSDQHYLLTRSYHLTLSLTDQHPVLVSNTSAKREVDKNGLVSLNPSPFTAAAGAGACYVKPFGEEAGPSNWGLNSTFTHSFISLVSSWLHVWKSRHREGPIFLSTRLSDDNDGIHFRVKNYIIHSNVFLFFYSALQMKFLRSLYINCLISSQHFSIITHLFHKVPGLPRLKRKKI